MTIIELREVHQSRPFRPFWLELADGNRVHVAHPECLSYYPRGRTIAVAIAEDVIKIIDVYLVASIQIGNDRARQRKKRS